MSKSDTFAVIYRRGGKMACEWHRILERYETKDAAKAKADEIERMGYKALVTTYSSLESIGLPIGWEAGCVDWEKDSIGFGSELTTWRKHVECGEK